MRLLENLKLHMWLTVYFYSMARSKIISCDNGNVLALIFIQHGDQQPHMPLGTWNEAGEHEEVHFLFNLILMNLNLSSFLRPVVTYIGLQTQMLSKPKLIKIVFNRSELFGIIQNRRVNFYILWLDQRSETQMLQTVLQFYVDQVEVGAGGPLWFGGVLKNRARAVCLSPSPAPGDLYDPR